MGREAVQAAKRYATEANQNRPDVSSDWAWQETEFTYVIGLPDGSICEGDLRKAIEIASKECTIDDWLQKPNSNNCIIALRKEHIYQIRDTLIKRTQK